MVSRRTAKKRAYDSSGRKEAALETRQMILLAARTLFCERGYTATTMSAVAEAAGIALDTVYATVGKKPALLALLIETSISGSEAAVRPEERDYVRAIRAEETAKGKLKIYAAALRGIQARLAPLFRVLQQGATVDPVLAKLWKSFAERRAKNMRLLARELEETGQLRRDLSVEMVADVLWSMNAPEYYLLLAEERGWTPEQFEHWLGDAWCRLLLETA